MEKVLGGAFTALFASVMVTGIVFLMVILGTLLGALAGWCVGLFFGESILGVLAAMGVKGITMWQFGAFLGFVGGFFRSTLSSD